jgi:phosphoribosyl-ATP pyrophosphohydrolase
MSAPETSPEADLAKALEGLAKTIAERQGGDPSSSYTAQLLAAGPLRIAKKLGEEGVEAALALAAGTDQDVASEIADLFYHAIVGLAARGIGLDQVATELNRRSGTSGLTEKASRQTVSR